MTISKTTWKLIKYSKTTEDLFNYVNLQKFLSEDYYTPMHLSDAMQILLRSLTEILNEPKFNIAYGRDEFIVRLITAPLTYKFFDKTPDKSSSEIYDIMIYEILNGMRFTRVNWCKN